MLIWVVFGIIWMPPVRFTNLLKSPELASAIIVYWNGKKPVLTNPPFGGVQWALPIQWFATPIAKLSFPFGTRDVAKYQ